MKHFGCKSVQISVDDDEGWWTNLAPERFMLKGAVISKVKAAVAFPLKNIAALIFKHFADCNLRSCVAES